MKANELTIKSGMKFKKPKINLLTLLLLLIGLVLAVYCTISKGIPVSQNMGGEILYSEDLESSGSDSLFFIGFASIPYFLTAFLCAFIIQSKITSIVWVSLSQLWLYLMLFLIDLDVRIGNAMSIGDNYLVSIIVLSLCIWLVLIHRIVKLSE